MAYRPTLKSIGVENSQPEGYRPTLESIKSVEAKEYPYVNSYPNPKQNAEAMKDLRDALKGASQAFINTPEEAANVFGKHLYDKFNYAPKNKAAELGAIGGDVGSFFLPSGAVSGTLKAASLIPKAAKAIKSIQEGIKSKPIINALKNIGQTAGETALFQAEKNPKSTPLDITKAGTLGGALSLASNALTNQNPLIRTAAKLGTGGLLGYQFNGLPGAAEGAAASMFLPKALQEMGIGKSPLSVEMLTQKPNPKALAKYQAGKRLDDVGSPAEVFENPVMGARQGEISRTESGAQAMSNYGKERIAQQSNAIKSLLNKIYPNTKKSNNEVANSYKKAYENNLSQNALHDLMEDQVISQASQKVLTDPAYAKDLKNVRPDSFAYLDQVKRSINDMEQSAIRSGEKNKARIYRDSAENLTKVMDKEAPIYKQSRELSQKKIIRQEMLKRMNKREITGKNFYKEFLSNENKFNQILDDVKNIPGAQQDLKDMKLAWDNLIGFDTPAMAAGMSAKHTNTAREGFQKFWNEFKEMFGAPRDVERANFIHNPKWWDKFDEVAKYKDKADKQKSLSDLIARGLSGASLESVKERNRNNKTDRLEIVLPDEK